MSKVNVATVFKPGGQPTVTYVSRDHLKLEQAVRRAIALPNAFVSITGPSKSGKTVLCRTMMAGHQYVWVEGGQLTPLTNLWLKVASELEQPSEITRSQEKQTGIEAGVSAGGKAKIPFLIEGGGAANAKGSQVTTSLVSAMTEVDRQGACLDHMVRNDIALVIDDFHYIERAQQMELIRSLRGAVFNGLKVILLSVPHHAYDAQQAEIEISGRFVHVEVPEWSSADLREIAGRGFSALNVKCPKKIIDAFADEAQGSPNLMQQFCWDLCFEEGIDDDPSVTRRVSSRFDSNTIFRRLAADAGQPIYDRLASGPQSRTQRLPRQLRQGGTADIYEAILIAISSTGPKKKLSYDEIRSALSDVLIDKTPQKIEVSNALTHLSKISEGISQNSRPIEWLPAELKLVLADPLFRFFLRWKVRQGT
ncbi:AAA family ATPase [Hyphomicrobium sp.]|uniref:AAA family ATPase n=1 Tax=Hyphomicrobium sp. TaxID=82 RepID=UPI002C8DE8B7|nr:AAA family ATPase [Hyphomicrobium sp.]HRN87861.1 AAA family ATPase [Hyphomicrobium sp.]HRQ27215.1 AAA family ATPase [Hyphomicrobium sp.]